MVHFQRILLATDFSTTSARAVEYAILLARTFHAELHVLEVEIPQTIQGDAYLPLSYFEDLERRAPRQLGQVIGSEARKNLRVTTVTRHGSPYLEITNYARDHKMDLIVLGTHGRGGLSQLLVGSVA
jgi:nucleotide-binding universal stress UspA family protein